MDSMLEGELRVSISFMKNTENHYRNEFKVTCCKQVLKSYWQLHWKNLYIPIGTDDDVIWSI